MSRPDTTTLRRVLSAVRARQRNNLLLQVAVDLCIGVLGVLAGWQLYNAVMPLSWNLGVWLPVLGVAAVVVRAGVTAWRPESLSAAAARADRSGDLHDELTSAWWFSRHEPDSDWIDLHLERAVDTAGSLDPAVLFPARRPSRLRTMAVLAAVFALLQAVPVPRVFDDVVDRIAQVLPGGEDQPELIADLQEGTEGEEELLQQEEPDELLLPADEAEEGEPGESQEEGQLQDQGEEPPEGAEQQEAEQGEQSGEQAEQQEGEQAEAENPEEQPGEGEGEPEPDPNASQQPGEGEQADEAESMLPGGEEVFLQEGGEDMEQAEMSEEEMGHATREGGGEEQLEEGEATTLEVQLQQEMLELAEEQLPPPDPEETEEEKEELTTKMERSFLEFENMPPTEQFAIQELLQAESIPWRYRQLVLKYFRTLRERDNANRDGQRQDQR